MKYILALDEGTSSARAIVFDGGGRIVSSAQREFAQIFPEPGQVEHDAMELWTTQLSVAVDALARANLAARDVAGIGITNQRETTIVWDRSSGLPVYNAIVWQDRRAAAECDRLRAEGHEAFVRERTGLVLDPYFSATKLAWILNHVPDARPRACRGELAFGTVDSWLLWKLTGGRVHATDVSNASRTLLFNIHDGTWDEELLALFDIPAELLPEVRGSSEVYAEVSAGFGLDGIPIGGIAGDQQAALFGQLCVDAGQTKNTYGTGCFMLQFTGETAVASENRLLTTVAWRTDGRLTYALEGSVFVGGAVVQWLRDGLGIIRHSNDVEPLAASVPDTGGVYLVPAFSGLGAPHWDAHARGAIVGITRGTTAAHIARAALEGVAYQVADLADAMCADSGAALPELRVDGGASCNSLKMQFQADILGVPIVVPRVTETTALGAAYLAGLAVGYWKNTDELSSQREIERRYEPAMSADRVAEMRRRWRQAVERAKGWDD